MKVTATRATLKSLSGELLVLPLTRAQLQTAGTGRFPGKITFADLNKASNGKLLKSLKKEVFLAAHMSSLLLRYPEWCNFDAILFVGWEEKERSEFELGEEYRKLGNLIWREAKALNAARAFIAGTVCDFAEQQAARALVQGLELSEYEFTKYKSKPQAKSKTPGKPDYALKQVQVVQTRKLTPADMRSAQAGVKGTLLARDLINMPACDCTPAYLVQTARKIASASKMKIQVFDKKRLTQMKAGGLLSVAMGSDLPPYLIKMVYKPSKKARKVIALVGKGITFDSGGYSIKPASGMETMKVDMSGAAAVLGAMQAIATIRPNVEVRAYIPTCENMINGHANRPGDVIRAMNGKSIEILNTDAEGRLILADALTLACRDGAEMIVDLATLTGACMVALGGEYAGLFSSNDKLAEMLDEAAKLEGERLWRMPLAPEYKKLIKSPIADIKNTGGRLGGAITAALFLQEFVEDKVAWAHLDIAGPATSSGSAYLSNGGVGFGVRTLVRLVESI